MAMAAASVASVRSIETRSSEYSLARIPLPAIPLTHWRILVKEVLRVRPKPSGEQIGRGRNTGRHRHETGRIGIEKRIEKRIEHRRTGYDDGRKLNFGNATPDRG